MRRLPWLTAAVATTLLMLVVLVPPAMAKPSKVCSNSGGPNAAAPKNPNCYPVSAPNGQYEFRPCKDGTAPPCAAGKDFSGPLNTVIPTGAVFLALGAMVLGYLGWHRRQTLRLNT